MEIAQYFKDTPWPENQSGTILFLLDTTTRIEVELLQAWISAHQPEAATWNCATTNLASGKIDFGSAEDPLIVPLRILWLPPGDSTSRLRDLLFGNPRRPVAIRANWITRKHPERVQPIYGKPAMLSELKERFESQLQLEASKEPQQFTLFILSRAKLALDVAERRLMGTRYRFPSQVSEQMCTDPAYRSDVEHLAAEQHTPVEKLWGEARNYMTEMIAIPSAFWLDMNIRFNNLVLGLGYEKQLVSRPEDLERVGEILRSYPAILLWTHKTYLDGMVVPKVLYDNDLPVPHSFGGANMSFAGLGYLIRRGGAIFIRRSFQDNPLYKLTLRHYIALLMNLRFPLSWSFEGTRSRLGKLMPPRYGLLKYVLEACYSSGAEKIHIIPVAISYDLIRDVEEYATEQVGRVKQAESLSWFLRYLSSLRKPMGRLYVDFGEPVVLEKAPDPNDRLALQKIAFEIAVEANRVTPLTVPSLLTMSLLGAAPQALTERELRSEVKALWDWANTRQIRVSDDFNPQHLEHMQGLLQIMVDENIISRYAEGPEVVYGVALEQHPVASYYRNTTIHFFVNKAIIELALLAAWESGEPDRLTTFWNETERLRDLFKFEFFYAPTDRFRNQLREELQQCAPDWECQIMERDQTPESLLKSMRPLVSHSTLLTYLEAYNVVADLLAGLAFDQGIEEKACVEQALKYGRQAYLQRRISSEASIGKLLFTNAFKLMSNRDLTQAGDSGLAIRRRAQVDYLRLLKRRIEGIRLIVADQRSMPERTLIP